ncbi:MAG: insulinase family protein [Firmicutes bacterium]|nr:insulinase family protein [Bacillota bacterium]
MHEIIALPNGLRVVIEQMPHLKSVTAGLWVGAGSCRESRANNGISHLIEHMLFKGTKHKTAKQIAETIDNIGGQLNAFTSRDCTCFYAKSLSDRLDTILDVISDMLFNSLFDIRDIALEKSVILEEISMYEDTSEELVHDILMEKSWRKNSLGYPILGVAKSLGKIDRDEILQYLNNYYIPSNSVLAIVGSFEKERLLEMVQTKFGGWKNSDAKIRPLSKPKFIPTETQTVKDIEQTHLCIGYNTIARGHALDYSLMVVNTILGSGMSSRLFQKIREDRGLVYSIYSYLSMFAKAGMFTIYAGMNSARVDEVKQLIFDETKSLAKDGISNEDIQKCKEQLKGNLILGLESTSSRMHSYGQSLLLTNSIRTSDEMIKRIDAVDAEKIHAVIESTFNEPSVAMVKNSA